MCPNCAQSVPDIDTLAHLPRLLDGLLAMLADTHTEIRSAATRLLDNFLRQVHFLSYCHNAIQSAFRH